MGHDPKHQKEGERERTSSDARKILERERAETSFVGPGESRRATGSFTPPPERGRVTQKAVPAAKVTGSIPLGATTTGGTPLTEHQKQMLSSAFQDAARLQALKAAVGSPGDQRPNDDDDDDDEATWLGKRFNGKTPPRELTGRDLFKTVQAPVQSREGRRNHNVFHQVLAQFAIGYNPRYEPDGPGKPRGHIYLWDVSRAMNCEVPHFVGTRELSLTQTVDWLRGESISRGWTRASQQDAVELANKGQLVIALPKEIRLRQLGVVAPEPTDKDGRPRVAGAGVKLGYGLSVYELLGVYAAEYLTHA